MCAVEKHTDFDVATCVEEHVVGFDVAMYDFLRVEMRKTLARLRSAFQDFTKATACRQK